MHRMIISHTHPEYVKKRSANPDNKYNGAYYYSKDIVKYIIPNVKTDRNWITVRLPEVPVPEHSIVFIHNNRNPNYYSYLKDVKDCVLVCSTAHTYENMKFISEKVILLPLSVDIENVRRYKVKYKTKEMAFAGRRCKINNKIPSRADILTDIPQTELIKKMAMYEKIFAVGRTAIQAKILGCEVLPYDNMYPDTSIWQPLDCKDASIILQEKIDNMI